MIPTPARPSPLRELFGERLYSAAERVVQAGGPRDVRLLQAGAVVTGVVGNARVYIRRSTGKVEGECSCSERSPCVHVVAVAIAAERSASTTAPTPAERQATLSAGGPRLAPLGSSGSPAAPVAFTTSGAAAGSTSAAVVARQQRLCYLLTRSPAGTLQVAVWIGSPMGLPGQDGIHLFSLRPPAGGSDYPRYVQPNDREILRSLSSARADGPLPLTGQSGHALLLQIVATGRAFWHSLRSPVLRTSPPRQALFSWGTLPNGDQELRCEVAASVAVLLDIEPPLYIDSSTAETGRLESPLPLDLVRKYWQRTPVAPEQVAETNAQIARESTAARTAGLDRHMA